MKKIIELTYYVSNDEISLEEYVKKMNEKLGI